MKNLITQYKVVWFRQCCITAVLVTAIIYGLIDTWMYIKKVNEISNVNNEAVIFHNEASKAIERKPRIFFESNIFFLLMMILVIASIINWRCPKCN